MHIANAIRRAVVGRAHERCEFCLLPQSQSIQRFHLDHLLPKKHGGQTLLENLALTCSWCNFHKGTDLSGIEPETGVVVALFNPRKDRWGDHFSLRGAVILGTTAIGRATIATLKLNQMDRVRLRDVLVKSGFYSADLAN
jgi:hypothetical protein